MEWPTAKAPTTAEEWWKNVEEHWVHIEGILWRFLPLWDRKDLDGHFEEKPLCDKIKRLKSEKNRDLASYFQAAWGEAPDNQSIHEIPGWFILCDLCSEEHVLYDAEEQNMYGQWKNGPPTCPGLYVIEWMNGGGLAVYMVVWQDGALYLSDVEVSLPKKGSEDMSQWAIRRHCMLPQTPIDDTLRTYSEQFDPHIGRFKEPLEPLEPVDEEAAEHFLRNLGDLAYRSELA